ncbi:hypothetical protein D3C71_1623900 [compost metagenome]
MASTPKPTVPWVKPDSKVPRKPRPVSSTRLWLPAGLLRKSRLKYSMRVLTFSLLSSMKPLDSSCAEAIANCEVPAATARAIMLHFITRIVICSFGF